MERNVKSNGGSQWFDARADLRIQRFIEFNVRLLTAVLFVEEDKVHAVSVGPSLACLFSLLVFSLFLSLSLYLHLCPSNPPFASLCLPVSPSDCRFARPSISLPISDNYKIQWPLAAISRKAENEATAPRCQHSCNIRCLVSVLCHLCCMNYVATFTSHSILFGRSFLLFQIRVCVLRVTSVSQGAVIVDQNPAYVGCGVELEQPDCVDFAKWI